MATTTSDAAAFIPDDQVQSAIVLPVTRQSVAARVSTQVTTTNHRVTFPVVASDPTAHWAAEGQEITPSESQFDQIEVTPSKVVGLTIATSEALNDSSPDIAKQVGDGLARDIVTRVDAAYFGALAAPAPSGLGALSGVTTVNAGAKWSNIDPFIVALSNAATRGATVTGFVANPADELELAKIKRAKDSNEPLLEVSPQTANQDAPVRMIAGVPLYVSPAVAPGVVWGIPSSASYFVVRSNTELAVDTSVFFTSDSAAIRAIMRVGFAFPHQIAIQKIVLDGAEDDGGAEG